MNKINSLLGLTGKQDSIEKINVEYITKNPYQPRQHFDNENLQELASSIKQYGILQPIILRKQSPKNYQIIAGERRYRAAKLAGLNEVPAIIREFTDDEAAEIAIIENLQRENLNYFEEAEGFKKLIDQFNLTQEEVAKKVGKSQPMIANKLRLLKISQRVRKEISSEILTERHLRALIKVKNEEDQLLLLEKIYEGNLNVKQTDELVKKFLDSARNDNSNLQEKDIKRKSNITDYRLFQNTLKKSLKDIEIAGVKTEYADKIKEDHLEVCIKIYK